MRNGFGIGLFQGFGRSQFRIHGSKALPQGGGRREEGGGDPCHKALASSVAANLESKRCLK